LEEKPITLYSGSVKPLRVLHHRWRVQRVLSDEERRDLERKSGAGVRPDAASAPARSKGPEPPVEREGRSPTAILLVIMAAGFLIGTAFTLVMVSGGGKADRPDGPPETSVAQPTVAAGPAPAEAPPVTGKPQRTDAEPASSEKASSGDAPPIPVEEPPPAPAPAPPEPSVSPSDVAREALARAQAAVEKEAFVEVLKLLEPRGAWPDDERARAEELLSKIEQTLEARRGARESERVLAEFDGLMTSGDYAAAREFAKAKAAAANAADPKDENAARVLSSALTVVRGLTERDAAVRRGAESLVGKEVSLGAGAHPLSGVLKKVDDEGLVVATIYVINREERQRDVKVSWKAITNAQGAKLAERGGLKLSAADRAIGAAYRAMGRADADAAAEALSSAEGHPLHERLVRRLAEAKAQAAYDAAMAEARRLLGTRSWEEASEVLGRALEAKPDDAEAKRLAAEVIARIGWRDLTPGPDLAPWKRLGGQATVEGKELHASDDADLFYEAKLSSFEYECEMMGTRGDRQSMLGLSLGHEAAGRNRGRVRVTFHNDGDIHVTGANFETWRSGGDVAGLREWTRLAFRLTPSSMRIVVDGREVADLDVSAIPAKEGGVYFFPSGSAKIRVRNARIREAK
jgi:hypothetical protein